MPSSGRVAPHELPAATKLRRLGHNAGRAEGTAGHAEVEALRLEPRSRLELVTELYLAFFVIAAPLLVVILLALGRAPDQLASAVLALWVVGVLACLLVIDRERWLRLVQRLPEHPEPGERVQHHQAE